MPLKSDHGLPNNAYQAPAAVKIGVTLLFSGSFSRAGAAISSKPASQRLRAGSRVSVDNKCPAEDKRGFCL